MDDIKILEEYLEENNSKNKIPYIVITSGTSGKDIIELCKKYFCVKKVIIFCYNYEKHKHYIEDFPTYVGGVFTAIEKVYEYIKSFHEKYVYYYYDFDYYDEYDTILKYTKSSILEDKYKLTDFIKKDKQINDFYKNYFINSEKIVDLDTYTFSKEELRMDKQLIKCPVISAKEYDDCYFLIHKIYSFFFKNIEDKNIEPSFKQIYFDKFKYLLDSELSKIYDNLKDLVGIKDNNYFVEKSIRLYTNESCFAYLLNKYMRNFEKGLSYLSYYIGPLLYGLNKYIYDNPSFGLFKQFKLYRIIKCSKIDFYQYKINLGHIICFPSFTSTSYEEIEFKPTDLSDTINNNDDNKNMLNVKLVLDYSYKNGYISPGIIIDNNKGHDSLPLSKYNEKEVLLFPFTFAKINNIYSDEENGINFEVIEMEIIGRESYIEYKLRDDVENRILFSEYE